MRIVRSYFIGVLHYLKVITYPVALKAHFEIQEKIMQIQ